MKKLLLFALLLCAGLLAALAADAEVMINEIMAKNGEFTGLEAFDWIELYNDGETDVSLAGWHLSDKKSQPDLWTFPAGAVIKARGYVLVYCTGDADLYENKPRDGIFYAGFQLSVKGETVYLTDAAGESAGTLKYPRQYGNVSYGRSDPDGKEGFFNAATPKGANPGTVFAGMADRPVLETAPGFYPGTVMVSVSCEDPVYYTLDGSDPTDASLLYTGPVEISETAVLKTRACPEDRVWSYIAFGTYFINDESPVMVISMSTDPAYLTGSRGLFVKGNGGTPNYKQDWEYPICFELFDENGVRQLAQKGSFRITGNSSRQEKLKAVSVTARDAYGDPDAFYYNPFDDRDYASYHTLVVRATGSDAYVTRTRDALLTRLSRGLGIMYRSCRLCVVYYNGVYYGQYYLREKINKYSVAQWEGITDRDDIDNIDIVRGEGGDRQVMNGSNRDWVELRAFVRGHDLRDPENLKYVTDRLDVDSLFTWAAYEMLILNPDIENVRVYRVPGGKWKYILYDLDDGMQYTRLTAVYMLLDRSQAGGTISSQYTLLQKLLAVPEMRIRFIQILTGVVRNSFLYDTVSKPVAQEMIAGLETVLPRHFQANPSKRLNLREWRRNADSLLYYMRVTPKRVLNEAVQILNMTRSEKEMYLNDTLALLEEHNSQDKQ